MTQLRFPSARYSAKEGEREKEYLLTFRGQGRERCFQPLHRFPPRCYLLLRHRRSNVDPLEKTSKEITEATFRHRTNSSIRYGRPPKGSRTEQRGLAAQAHIHQEVKYLCEIIQNLGDNVSQSSTPSFQITFRKLFDVTANANVFLTFRRDFFPFV